MSEPEADQTPFPGRRVPDATTAKVTALVRLRGALQEARLPLELPGAEEQRAARTEMVDQLEDYVIPRLMTLDAPLLVEALQDVADRGLLPATDIPWLVDLRARRHARRWARHQGGPLAERGMRDYQAAALELGYLHHRYLRGTAPDDFSVRGQEHVEELRRIRPYISFPGQVVPTR